MSLPGPGDPLLLLHNPRCSKSRAALALLEERGVAHAVRRYLDDPLDDGELRELQRRLGRPVREWVRPGEEPARGAGLGPGAAEDAWLALLSRAPVVLERPILVGAERAVVGRPPETLLELL